ncbi:MAG: hypothetical protein JWN73_2528 [Betaproteobacteria bacterium]|nr:hypothetical protein [Betaproteobacteria bacterium]
MLAADDEGEDHRAWQHGIDLLRVGDRLLLVWGSAGNPPRPNLGGDWPHDVYCDWLEMPAAAGDVTIHPRLLVSRPEAQEPPSAAINSKGVILVTAEDGEDEINQRAGLWNARLEPLRPYPFMIRRGGHSGHAAALEERFLVVYGEGWQEGGGFMNRGTGRDVHARIVDGAGRPGPEIHLARGHRDGWPLVAASDRNWLAVWQRYEGPSLYCAVIDAGGRASAPRLVADGLPIRYAYDVAYCAALGRYVVAGNRGGQGFVALLDRAGAVLSLQGGLPPLASESRVLICAGGDGTLAVYPVAPQGIAVLRLGAASVELLRVVAHPQRWDYMGTTGWFAGETRVLFATLTTQGVRAFAFDL